jgi:hypothetical protein
VEHVERGGGRPRPLNYACDVFAADPSWDGRPPDLLAVFFLELVLFFRLLRRLDPGRRCGCLLLAVEHPGRPDGHADARPLRGLAGLRIGRQTVARRWPDKVVDE